MRRCEKKPKIQNVFLVSSKNAFSDDYLCQRCRHCQICVRTIICLAYLFVSNKISTDCKSKNTLN